MCCNHKRSIHPEHDAARRAVVKRGGDKERGRGGDEERSLSIGFSPYPHLPLSHSDSSPPRLDRPTARRGFSLVELMVVIVIIGLLSGVVTISVRSYLLRGKQTVARMEMAKIAQAIDTFYSQFDRYPTNDEGLAILVEKTDAFPDGLLNKLPVDPWGRPYEYTYPGRSGPYELVCYGADHQEGGTGADADLSIGDIEVAANDSLRR